MPAAEERATRQQVLDVAARLFREKGYAGTTQREIAKRCGIQAASLYYHFASKDDLLLEVLDYGIERIFAAVRAAVERLPEDAPIEQKVRAAAHAHLESFFVYGDYTATNIRVFGQAPKAVQRKNLALRDGYERYWTELFQQGQKRGEIRRGADLGLVRLFLLGALNRTVEWWDEDGALGLEDLADRFTAILFHGIGDARSAAAAPRRRAPRRARV